MSYIGNHSCDGKNWANSLRLQTTSFHLHNAVENDRNTVSWTQRGGGSKGKREAGIWNVNGESL